MRIEFRPAWDSFVESFREHPVRTVIRLAVVMYVTLLIVTLIFSIFDEGRTITIREP